ncbi:hypothetical protein, partial [Mycolicibacterium peregrinum]|uniref:hypothetical protein n=1 Tax=Mycolicibacterium peregrinum TaxID=43304 RepID=UPI001B805635
ITGNPGGPITLAKSAHTGPILLADDTLRRRGQVTHDLIRVLWLARREIGKSIRGCELRVGDNRRI